MPNDEFNQISKEIVAFKKYFVNSIKRAISCEDKLYSVIYLIQVYILMKISSFLNDKFVIIIIINIVLLYGPFEEKCPHFLFKARMTFKQIIEGVIGLLDCLIPKYEENNIKKENQ